LIHINNSLGIYQRNISELGFKRERCREYRGSN
jgi:hypothetical protein